MRKQAKKGQRALAVLAVATTAAHAETLLSEKDYLGELPVVLSVSRLAQPLNETPGAVTVIDRDMIRRSGARELAELLRLVPGFIVSHIEGGARPIAAYHADYDSITRHLQVMIDGRSVYSSLLVGSASFGMMGIVLEDIERIEVLRGSNSAAYGANAFQGVVNIITRHAVDTLGGMVSVNQGEGGIRDGTVRLGWGNEKAAFRVTAAQRDDNGFGRLNDSKRLRQAHFRGDLQPGQDDEVMLAAGHADLTFGSYTELGTKDEIWRNAYARMQWTHRLAPADEVKLSFTADEETYRNFYPLMRADGVSRRQGIEASHSLVANQNWRFVWGGQYRHEQVTSPDLFTQPRARQQLDLWQLYGNAEWRPHPQWVINAGGMWEDHSLVGSDFAPRLMVNFHVVPGQTLRIGSTEASKQPTLFELRSDWRYEGVPIIRASGNAKPEKIRADEIGYLGQFRPINLTVDVRVFREKIRDMLSYNAPCGGCPNDVINQDDNTQRGWETQLRWQPWTDTLVLLNHTELKLVPASDSASKETDPYRAPRHYSTLALFQKLPGDFDLGLIHYTMQPFFWVRKSDMMPAYRQTDLRLAKSFMLGSQHAEAAVFVRAIDGGHVDYVSRDLPQVYLDRRIHGTFRLDF